LFPTNQTFLNQDRMNGRKFEPIGGHAVKLITVIGNASARATERETGSQHARQTYGLITNPACFIECVGQSAFGRLEPDAIHGFLEERAILGFADSLRVRADQAATMARKRARVMYSHGNI